MSAANKAYSDNVLLGAGEIYIDIDGKGERYLGDTPGATLAFEATDLDVFASDGPDTSKRLTRVRTQVSRRLTATLRDMSMDNIALFVHGDLSNVAQATNQVTKFTQVHAGRSYQFAIGAADSVSVHKIKENGSVTSDSANNDSEANYVVNTELGRIYIPAGSNLVKDSATHGIAVKFKQLARQQITSHTKAIEGAARYVETPVHGEGRNLYIPQANIGASGEWELKSRDQEQQFQLAIESLGTITIDGVDQ